MNTDNPADSDRLTEIKASEAYYRSLIENVSNVIMVVCPDGAKRYVSPSIERSLGHTPKEVMEDKELRNVHPGDRALLEDAIAKTIESAGAIGPTIELRCRHKDGSWRHMEATGKAIRDESGQLVAVVNMLDITGRKRAEELLREYEKAVEGSDDMIAAVDHDYRYCLANAAFLRYRSMRKEQVLGRSVAQILGRDVFEQVVKDNVDRCFHGEIVRYEMKHTYPELGERELLISYMPVRGDQGIDRVATVIRDITDQKKAERALKEDEERFRLLFEKSVDPILLLDGDTFIECNEAAVRLMGCSSKTQLIGLHPSDVSPEHQPDGRLSSKKAQEIIDAALIEGMNHFEWKHRTFNGEDRWTDVSLTVIPIHGKRIMHTVWRDITERKQAEEALKNRERELEDKSVNLEEANVALRVLLKHRNQDKKTLENRVLTNIKQLVFPYIEKLRSRSLTDNQAGYLNIIESNLNEVISPFLQKMTAIYAHFTPTEIQVADLIKDGRTSKEIGELLKVGGGTVHTHRNNIRKKLGLSSEKTNLRTYLLSLQE